MVRAMSRNDTTRRGFLVLSAGAIAAATLRGAAPAGAQAIAGVPTPSSSFGFPVGMQAAGNTQISRYVHQLAAASDRVRTDVLADSTVRGQDIRYAIVSHPDNLAKLDDIARALRKIKQTPVSDAEAKRLTADLPAIIHLYANVHGNEPSGADALCQLLYELASRTDAANELRLRQLIAIVIPVQNPDGRDAARRVNLNAFDINRDWFAMTQPESPGKVALWSRYPGILGLDIHEQFFSAPGTFYLPPANDPVHREIPKAALEASDKHYTPAVVKAFDAKGYAWEHYHAYDLFYTGYGDVIPAQAWGAAGVLFEMENSNAFADKFARQFTAIDAAVTVAATDRQQLLTLWALQWRQNEIDGRAGELGKNFKQNPDSPAPIPASGEKVYGYALRTTRAAADVAHLVDRLRAFDVEVHVTTRAVNVKRLRAFGDADFGPATLGRGTIVIRNDQPMKRWINMLLEDDPQAAIDYFYDSAGWSNPALMSLQGGAIGEPLTPLLRRPAKKVRTKSGKTVTRKPSPPTAATLKAVDHAVELTKAPKAGAAAYAFALDAALAQTAAFALMKDGVEVRRVTDGGGGLPAGAAVVAGGSRSALDAARRTYGIRPVALSAMPSDTTVLRRPRIGLYSSAGTDVTELLFASSRGFARWLLAKRFGLTVTTVLGADIEAGALSRGIDVLVVPDGLATVVPGGQSVPNVVVTPPGAGLTPVGLANVQAFVAGGGTYLGWRTQGVVLAQGAGIAGDLATKAAPPGLAIPGLPITIDLHDGTVATRGLATRSYAYNVLDPILVGGGSPIATYPTGSGLRSLGYTAGLSALAGTVAATRITVGKGFSYLFAFDPAYRGYVEGTQRLVGNVLLEAPQVGGASVRAAALAGAGTAAGAGRIRFDLFTGGTVVPTRYTIVRVAAADAGALRAARDAIVAPTPEDLVLADADGVPGAVELRAVDRDPMSGHAAGWVGEVMATLAKAGVAPTFVLA